MSIAYSLLFDIGCDCEGCTAQFISRSSVPDRNTSCSYYMLSPEVLEELGEAGWLATADGDIFCPEHAKGITAPMFPPENVYIEDMGFSKDVLWSLSHNGIRTLRRLMLYGPGNLFDPHSSQYINFPLGIREEFVARMRECGFKVTEEAFVPTKNLPDYWLHFPEPTIDETRKLTKEEYDALTWEEKIIAWYLTDKGGHLFFSWRDARPDNWKEYFDELFAALPSRTLEHMKIGSQERLGGIRLGRRVGLTSAQSHIRDAIITLEYGPLSRRPLR